jgi:hypothetical protein
MNKKLDKYFHLFNPRDDFYHKYFNTYNSSLNDVTINSYYKLFFHNITIEKVLKEYFKGLNWVVNYYFNNITDNIWYYPFAKSPLLYNIVNQYSNFSSILTKVNSNNFLLTQLEQFLFIKMIDINKEILPQLSSLNNILGSSDLNKIAKFILNNKKYFYNITKLFDNIFENKEKIIDCTSSIFLNKCHLLILEGYIDIKEFATEFRNYLPLEYQRKYYPNIDKLVCL